MHPEPRPTVEEAAEFIRDCINQEGGFETDLVTGAARVEGRTEVLVDIQRMMPGYYTRATRIRIRVEEVPCTP